MWLISWMDTSSAQKTIIHFQALGALFLALMLTLGRQKTPSVSGLDRRNPFFVCFFVLLIQSCSFPLSVSVCWSYWDVQENLGEFALLAMKRICIVYETTKSTSSKSNNSMLFSFFILFFFFFVLFYFYEIYPKMSDV